MWRSCRKLTLSICLIASITTIVFSGISCKCPRETDITGKLEIPPEPMKSAPRRYNKSDTTGRIVGVHDKQIKAVLEILDAREDGDVDKTMDLMRRHRLTPQKLGDLISDMIYSVMDTNLTRATRHFSNTKDTEFSIPDYNLRIKRGELNDYRVKLELLISKTYDGRGGRDRFNKNKKIILRYENEIWKRIWRIFASQELPVKEIPKTIRTNEP